jgi:hypothetical protein
MTSRQNPHLTLETLALPKKNETARQRTLAELSFNLSVLCLAFFLARPGFQVSSVDFALMSVVLM